MSFLAFFVTIFVLLKIKGKQQFKGAFRSASYSKVFPWIPAPVGARYLTKDPGQNIRYHFAFLSAAVVNVISYTVSLGKIG